MSYAYGFEMDSMFSDEFETIEEALKAAREQKISEGESGACDVLIGEVARAESFLPDADYFGEMIVEHVDDSILGDLGGDATDTAFDLTSNRVDELGKLIHAFLLEHGIFMGAVVTDIETHKLDLGVVA